MSDISNIQIELRDTFEPIVERIEKAYNVKCYIDTYILIEVNERFEETLKSYDMQHNPNFAKVASAIAFWIRKLKPISNKEQDNVPYRFVNELAGLLFAIIICANKNRKLKIDIPQLINLLKVDIVFKDLLRSYRYNSHSPHSSAIFFEIIFNNSVDISKIVKKEK